MKKGAVIGFGGQGKQLALAMKRAGIEVVAVCDNNPKVFSETPVSKESWAASFPTLAEVQPPPKTYHSSDVLFKENPGLDVVCVATWTQDRAPVTIAAVKSGAKAILCEEPMALSLADAQKIIDVCEDHRVLLTVHHTRRWWPAHRKVKELIQAGRIGELRSIYISCGGARLGMLGTHWIDFVRWVTGCYPGVNYVTGWLGDISEKDPRGDQFRDPPGQILVDFDNGVKAFIEQGPKIALMPDYIITGTTGRICGYQSEKPTPHESWKILTLKNPEVSPVRNYAGEIEQAELQVPQEIDWKEQGVEALKELLRGETSCSGEDGYKTLEVLIAAHLSHDANNLPMMLPLTGDRIINYRLQHP